MSDNFNNSREIAKEPNNVTQQFLTFTTNREEYGVDIMTVREIKGWTDTTRLPGTPEFMRGVINLRGLIIPIFDLKARFAMGLTSANAKNVVIILAVGTRTIGILVDAVSDILDAASDQIKPPPSSPGNPKEQCVSGLILHNDRMVVLLSVEKLFDLELLKKTEDLAA